METNLAQNFVRGEKMTDIMCELIIMSVAQLPSNLAGGWTLTRLVSFELKKRNSYISELSIRWARFVGEEGRVKGRKKERRVASKVLTRGDPQTGF